MHSKKFTRKIRQKSLKRLSAIITTLVFFMPFALADVNSDLNSFFNGLGYSSNNTSPTAYQGQMAGYYTGGSVFLRNQVRNVQIASVTLPGYNAGCGGIDLFNGGFSFVNSAALEDVMKNVVNNAGTYAFMLGMDSYLPQESNIMKYLEDLQNTVNQASINSCQTGAALVGGLWPKTQTAEQQVCQTVGTGTGLFTDWAAAHQGCGVGGQTQAAFTKAASDPRFKNLLLGQGNLAWQALMQNGWTAGDPQLAEFLMSLSGSLIIRQAPTSQGALPTPSYLAPLATDASVIKALLYGGTADVYVCDTTTTLGCLNPEVSAISIASSNGLASQVQTILDGIVNDVATQTPLSTADIGFLNATQVPILKFINVETAVSQGQAVDVSKYTDLIAVDILNQYLEESLEVVASSAHQLNWPEDLTAQFMQGITGSEQAVAQLNQNAWQQLSTVQQLVAQTQQEEQVLAGYLSSDVSQELDWANGVQ